MTDDEEEEEDDEVDNRRIQERYEREMLDKGGRDDDPRPSTSAAVTRSASTRSQKSKDAELYPVKEVDEIIGEMETRKRGSKKSYSHKEAYHYGTLPRKAKSTRPSN